MGKKNQSNAKWYALVISLIATFMFILVIGGFVKIPESITMAGGQEKPNVNSTPQGPESQDYWVTLSVDPTTICVAESSVGSIASNMPNAVCTIFANTGSGYGFYQNAVLDSTGSYSRSQYVDVAGTAELRATCADSNGNYRISNVATLVVTDCDSDGDGFTNSQEIANGTNPFDPNDYPGSHDNL